MQPTSESPTWIEEKQKRIYKSLGLATAVVLILSASSHLTNGFNIKGRVERALSGDVSGKLEADTAGFPLLEAELSVHEVLWRFDPLLTGINAWESRSMKSDLSGRKMASREKARNLAQEEEEKKAKKEYAEKLARWETTKEDFQ